ncbi:MAG: alkaline phosphatase family protein [Proteobacteria bacterium]|nr:alkaline phosphatase family protein [Pseudomonadota bacterium]MCP4918995.1 alkaline phosphatase family protein [Pseudomonadota bacterium]
MLLPLLACVPGVADLDSVASEPRPGALVLVSLDGFRNSYMDAHDTPALDAMAERGVRADALVPPYPTLTFPSHYTAVTGLYPEHHGIVGNHFWDPDRDASYSMSDTSTVTDGSWYGGEPIWATASKARLRNATLFWVGSEAEIAGERPGEWLPYSGSMSFDDRVDLVLEWLARPDDTRPRLITLYLNQPDHTGHAYGPDGFQIASAVAEVDAAMGRLVEGIESLEQTDVVNVLVTADHGMSALSRDRVVFLDEAIQLDEVGVYSWGTAAHFWPSYDHPETDVDTLLASLATLEHIDCARKEDLDEELHHAENARIPPVICIAEDGWTITSREWFTENTDNATGGAHGFDPRAESMHGIFVAAGPGLAPGTVEAFENVHLYELMCALLGLDAAPNDGDPAVVEGLLR